MDAIDELKIYCKENFRKLWNVINKFQQGRGEEFNEVYWHVKSLLRSKHDMGDKDIDDMSTIAAYLALYGNNVTRIAKMAKMHRHTVRAKLSKLRHLI